MLILVPQGQITWTMTVVPPGFFFITPYVDWTNFAHLHPYDMFTSKTPLQFIENL